MSPLRQIGRQENGGCPLRLLPVLDCCLSVGEGLSDQFCGLQEKSSRFGFTFAPLLKGFFLFSLFVFPLRTALLDTRALISKLLFLWQSFAFAVLNEPNTPSVSPRSGNSGHPMRSVTSSFTDIEISIFMGVLRLSSALEAIVSLWPNTPFVCVCYFPAILRFFSSPNKQTRPSKLSRKKICFLFQKNTCTPRRRAKPASHKEHLRS